MLWVFRKDLPQARTAKSPESKRARSASNQQMTALLTRKHCNPVAIGGLMLYAGSFTVLLRNRNFEPGDALIVLVLFGIIFPALAWLATLRAVPLPISVRLTAREMFVMVACVVALSIYLIGGPQWIDQHLPNSWIDSPKIKLFITLAEKLIVFVLIPFGIFRFAFGYRLRDFGIQREGLRALRLEPLAVGSHCWRCVAGLSTFSRQRGSSDSTGQIQRLPIVTWSSTLFRLASDRSRIGRGIFLSRPRAIAIRCMVQVRSQRRCADVSGLRPRARAGIHFRQAGTLEGLGTNPTALEATAYSIVVLAVSGILFGVMWAPTRNLAALMLLHAAGDLLPNFAEFDTVWQIAK